MLFFFLSFLEQNTNQAAQQVENYKNGSRKSQKQPPEGVHAPRVFLEVALQAFTQSTEVLLLADNFCS